MNDYDRKRVLVTGGAGFLGSHLCERLLNEGDEVLCVDNFFTGRRTNIAHLIGNPRFELLRHDVTFPLFVEVDEIYNLACPASPVHYQHDPVQTTKTSVHGAINMLGLAKRTGARIFRLPLARYMGTHKFIHKPKIIGGTLTLLVLGPAMMRVKDVETLFFDYHRQHGTEIKVARIFNTYGPRMHPNDGRVVSNFIVQALKGEPITVYGDGAQTRSFCYADDLIEGFIRLMASDQEVTGPVNLGNPGEFTIRQLAAQVLKIVGSKASIVEAPLPSDDPKQRKPDISLAQKILGWEPSIPLEEGLCRTIDYFRQQI